MTIAPILAMSNFSQMFVLEFDVSNFGVGNTHLTAYFSQVLGSRNKLKPIYERELIVMLLA